MPSFFMIGVMALFISLLHGTPVLAASCEVGTYACGDVCISVAEFCCAQGSVSYTCAPSTGGRIDQRMTTSTTRTIHALVADTTVQTTTTVYSGSGTSTLPAVQTEDASESGAFGLGGGAGDDSTGTAINSGPTSSSIIIDTATTVGPTPAIGTSSYAAPPLPSSVAGVSTSIGECSNSTTTVFMTVTQTASLIPSGYPTGDLSSGDSTVPSTAVNGTGAVGTATPTLTSTAASSALSSPPIPLTDPLPSSTGVASTTQSTNISTVASTGGTSIPTSGYPASPIPSYDPINNGRAASKPTFGTLAAAMVVAVSLMLV